MSEDDIALMARTEAQTTPSDERHDLYVRWLSYDLYSPDVVKGVERESR
jgi:hypothetical protein